MSKDIFDPNRQIERIKKIENAAGQPHINTEHGQDEEVKLLVDETISPAMFKPHPFLINTYLANSLTIKAVRKELFSVGDDHIVDLELIAECQCGKTNDLQFWKLCPHCGKTL